MDFQIDVVWHDVKEGDSRAWSRLVEEYAGLVYGVARRCGLDVADAEDCAQFTWLALYKQRHKIRDAAAIPAWLSRTAKRRALRMVQKTGREFPLTDQEPTPTDQPEGLDPFSSELRAALPRAMDELDARCRQVLLALFLSDQESTYRDLARELDVDPNTIGPMRSRCLGRLQKILKKMGFDLH